MSGVLAAALACAILAFAGVAVAEGEPDARRACLEAHVAVQERRLAGDLVGAAAAAVTCAADVCPVLPRAECSRWGEDIAREMPMVTISIRGGGSGDVRLFVDGEQREAHGRPMGLNPGHHSIEVHLEGRTERRSVHLVRGQAEEVSFDLSPVAATVTDSPETSRAPAPGSPNLIGPIVLGAAGAAAFVVFGVAAGLGTSEYGDLEGSCAPRCSQEQTGAVDTKLLVADAALGIGSGLLVAGGVWLVVELVAPAETQPRVGARGLSVSF